MYITTQCLGHILWCKVELTVTMGSVCLIIFVPQTLRAKRKEDNSFSIYNLIEYTGDLYRVFQNTVSTYSMSHRVLECKVLDNFRNN